jgi:NAD(P)-dependent dehydrogenase (short-subunit alcohol dehydrogenase family)
MPIILDFSGKLVLVTGGGRSIGLAIARAIAKAGADVAITYTSKDATPVAEELSKEFGTVCKAFKCEVSDSGEVNAMLAAVKDSYGRDVDIGIANAGIALWKDAHENTDDEFRRIFEVNTFGGYYLARALARSWLGEEIPVGSSTTGRPEARQLGKQILFVSSISAIVAMSPQRQMAYNASKAAVTMMAKSLAAEWAHLGITVNSISPGYVATDMIANPPNEEAEAWATEWTQRTPVGHFATAEQIGEFVATLVSDSQGGMGWMTGSDVVIDGGYTLL